MHCILNGNKPALYVTNTKRKQTCDTQRKIDKLVYFCK